MTTLKSRIEAKMEEINSNMNRAYDNSTVPIEKLISFFSVPDSEFWICYNSITKQNLLNRFHD